MAECLHCDVRIDREKLESHEMGCAPVKDFLTKFSGESRSPQRKIENRPEPFRENMPARTYYPQYTVDRALHDGVFAMSDLGFQPVTNDKYSDDLPELEPLLDAVYFLFSTIVEVICITQDTVALMDLHSLSNYDISLEQFERWVLEGALLRVDL